MAYGWLAWKNRAPANAFSGRSREAKERAYLKGFRTTALELGISDAGASCPFSVLDDPGIDAGGAFDLGRWDAKNAARTAARPDAGAP